MMKNLSKKKLVSFLTIILILGFVSLASGVITVLAPSNGSNYSSTSSALLMVEFVNNTDILFFGTGQNQINASFYLVNGTQRTFIGNSSTCGLTSGQTYNCWTFVTPLTTQDGFYNVTATVFNSTANRNASTNTTSIYFDSIKPIIFGENFSTSISGGNYSQLVTINISAIDATTQISSVLFNISNSSGPQVTVVASREGSTNQFISIINASHFIEGDVNIRAIVNDTAGNINNSARIYNLTFDNTLPTVSFTCDDYTVDEDDVMDCNCVYSDALSGIASASFDSSPSTSNSGNNQQSSCTVTDRAGNVNVSTISYNVTGISGGSSSGSSGSSSSGTSSGSSSSGSSSSSNNTSGNTTTQNQSSGSANLLEGNQEDQTEKEFKLNYWIIGAVILVAGLGITVAVLIKKGILQRLLKFNK